MPPSDVAPAAAEKSHWRECTLGDVVTLQRGYDLPSQSRLAGEVPVVSSSGVSGLHAIAKVRGPGVVTGRYGTIGQVFFVRDDFWPLNTTLYVRDFKGNDPLFVSYFLRTLDFEAHQDKGAVPGINRNHLHMATVRLPPLSDQRAIARILSALDDKIEMNRKTAETLEAIARALFKSWFVDFDPVRAKMAGRRPERMNEDTAKLFPTELARSSIGQVPSGWRVDTLDALIELRRGHDLPATARRAGVIPIVSSGGISGSHDLAQAKAPGIVTGRYGTLGRVFLMEEDYWPLNTTLYSSDMKNNEPTYTFYTLAQVDFAKYSDKGAVPGINRNHLHMEQVIIPPVDVQRAFGRFAQEWRGAAKAFDSQSATLAGLRDALLPKLMSGELRVREAEHVVGLAT